MQFSFASRGRALPMTVRVCRALVWTQAAFVVLAGIFVVFAVTVFGNSNSIPFHGEALTGSRAALLGFVYIGAGLVLVYLGIELGHLAGWSRNVIVSAQVFLAVLWLYGSLEFSVSVVVNICFYAAIIGLLFAPDTRRALAGGAQPGIVAEPPPTTAEPDTVAH